MRYIIDKIDRRPRHGLLLLQSELDFADITGPAVSAKAGLCFEGNCDLELGVLFLGRAVDDVLQRTIILTAYDRVPINHQLMTPFICLEQSGCESLREVLTKETKKHVGREIFLLDIFAVDGISGIMRSHLDKNANGINGFVSSRRGVREQWQGDEQATEFDHMTGSSSVHEEVLAPDAGGKDLPHVRAPECA
ncbi:hypothetical protein [Agrobacterium sp. CG674]